MKLAFWRKSHHESQAPELTEEEKWAIWCPAQANYKVVLEPVQKTLYPADPAHPPFISTGASQWSTTDFRARGYSALRLPIDIQRDISGHIVGITIRRGDWKEQVQHWKWLLHNPRIAKSVVTQIARREQTLRDSALFL